jgi:hypothetical protein
VEKGTVNIFSGSTVLGVLGIVMSKKKEWEASRPKENQRGLR